MAVSNSNRHLDRQGATIGGLEEVLKYNVLNFFLNKVSDGSLQNLYDNLLINK